MADDWIRILRSEAIAASITLTKRPPDNKKYDYGAETATTKFFSAIAGDQGSEEIVHDFFNIK